MAGRCVSLVPDVRVNTIVRYLQELGARHGHVEVRVIVVPDDNAFILRQWRIGGARKASGVRTDVVALDDDGARQAMTSSGVRSVR